MSRLRVALLVAAVVLLVAATVLLNALYGPNRFAGRGEREVFVSRGETFAGIVDSLVAGGVIRSRWQFQLTARIYGGTERMQVGKYVFLSGASNAEIFRTIRDGAGSQLIVVTVPEGLTCRAQARIFARALGIDSAAFAEMAYDPGVARSFGIAASSLEGYLLPETYRFAWNTPEEEILARLVGQFRELYTDSLRQRERDLGFTTRQVLTLASIVEGETRVEAERSTIAGVYLNRLRRNMRLEADPTIQYILPDGPRRLRYADLRMEHPYNTYRSYGLPPGPVNNPGRASILASLYPERHQYLFFVANARGGHWFSRSYSEHLRYVRMYRRTRAAPAASG